MRRQSFLLDIKLCYIYPATSAHIKKYLKKDRALVSETGENYQKIVKPYLEKNQFDPQWVYNIIDGKSERERILLETDDFLLLPDIMWDGTAIESMHLLGLVKTRDIHSIRDLKPEHIPILESFLEKTTVKTASQDLQRHQLLSILGTRHVQIWCSWE